MNRKSLSPENLIADFGPQSELAARVVGILARLVASKQHPKANVIYDEWKRIFGIVYGTDQLARPSRAPESKALSAAYRLEIGVEFSVLLFGIHTYYALLMKMLATEVIVSQGALGETFIGSLVRTRLRRQLGELESGEVLRRLNIRNAIEQDFFGWYPEAWAEGIHEALWDLVKALAAYDMGTFQIKPESARDLLKDLYHGLVPEAVRHALGEYYTPDWLAEHTLDLAGYEGDPFKTFLDPSCGSGTFLVMAIQKVRQWLLDRPIEWGSIDKKLEAVDLIRRNIVGFDLNPLAVIASRTNYLFALGPLLRYRSSGADFEIPVYLTDSVLLPGRTAGQGHLFEEDTVPFPMTVRTFHLPRQVVESHQVPDLMNLLHDSLVESHTREAFVARSIDNLGLSDADSLRASLGTLFDDLRTLGRQGKDHVWAKLIRNRYASLVFRHYFDFVVGNPPHVGWESLTPDWRKAAEGEYKHYGLFSLKGLASRHGGGKKDIAALFTYAVMDHFVKDGGTLAFVVHTSLFKTSGAGEGYRRFQLGNEERFAVEEAHDFRSFQPFQTHPSMRIKTRTLTFRAVKGRQTRYPVRYVAWSKVGRGCIPGAMRWEEAKQRLSSRELVATPLRGTTSEGVLSPWLTVSRSQLSKCKRIIAPVAYKPSYHAHSGVITGGLNGAYFLEVLEENPDGTLQVQNMYDVGKIKCPKVRATIEGDLVYPLLRGRSVARWHYKPEGHILVLQDPTTQSGLPTDDLQRDYPLTWSYIRKFETQLRERKAFQKFFDPEVDPFYSMYGVSDYTFAPIKVAWMDISETMKAVVLLDEEGSKIVLPEHTVMFLVAQTAEEAHYVAAVLNSSAVNAVVSGYIVDNHISTHPIQNIRIPEFDPTDSTHLLLVELSQAAHRAASGGDSAQVRVIQGDLDRAAAAVW